MKNLRRSSNVFLCFLLLTVVFFNFILCHSFILYIFLHWKHLTCTFFHYKRFCRLCLRFHLSVFSADNENHTKGDSPKTSSASGPQEQLWRSSQPQAQTQTQTQTQAQTQAQAQSQAHSSVKLQIQPQNITQRNHTLSRKHCHLLHSSLSVFLYCVVRK